MATGCRYDDAGPWNGGAACAGGHKPGTQALGDHLVATYGGRAEGYSCRQNTADPSKLSVHGTGRAIDYYPPDSATGDRVADDCIAHHERWGVQLVIWDHRDWTCDDGWTSYGGPSPHTDHLHIEQTIEASETLGPDDYEEGLTMADVQELVKAVEANTKATKRNTAVTIAQEGKTRATIRHQHALDRKQQLDLAGYQGDAEAQRELDEAKAELAAADEALAKVPADGD